MSDKKTEEAGSQKWESDLAWLMGAVGASHGEVCELLGCSRSVLARWAQGQEPQRVETLLALRRARLALEGAVPSARVGLTRVVWDLKENGASLFEELRALALTPGSARGVDRAALALASRWESAERSAVNSMASKRWPERGNESANGEDEG